MRSVVADRWHMLIYNCIERGYDIERRQIPNDCWLKHCWRCVTKHQMDVFHETV